MQLCKCGTCVGTEDSWTWVTCTRARLEPQWSVEPHPKVPTWPSGWATLVLFLSCLTAEAPGSNDLLVIFSELAAEAMLSKWALERKFNLIGKKGEFCHHLQIRQNLWPGFGFVVWKLRNYLGALPGLTFYVHWWLEYNDRNVPCPRCPSPPSLTTTGLSCAAFRRSTP